VPVVARGVHGAHRPDASSNLDAPCERRESGKATMKTLFQSPHELASRSDPECCGNTEAGWNKAVRRCMRLRRLLERVRRSRTVSKALATDIDAALKETFYDESEEHPPAGWDEKS
jgi:hypothetical protein